MLEKHMLTTGDIAKYCGVHYRTVIRWIQQGEMRSFKLPGRGDNRVALIDFIAFLKKQNIPIPTEFKASPKKVLVVDDDINVVKAIQRVLKRKGFELDYALDGFSAGIKLGTFSPAVLTLDLQMPGAGGLEVIKLIRGANFLADIKILVVSGLPKNELSRALEYGADDVLEKPFKNEVLLEKVMKLAGMEQEGAEGKV